jgi:DNA-directed RNA polymerase subunit RPC12/RpoP
MTEFEIRACNNCSYRVGPITTILKLRAGKCPACGFRLWPLYDKTNPIRVKEIPEIKIRFAVFPGTVISVNDWDTHWITANQLILAYGVNPRECIIIKDHSDEIIYKGILPKLLHLRPMTGSPGPDYNPVSEKERLRYPLK